MAELQQVPAHSSLPTFMRTLPVALLLCCGAACVGARTVHAHWVHHGPSKTLAAACLAYAGWRGFRGLRKCCSFGVMERSEPLLSLAGNSVDSCAKGSCSLSFACSSIRHRQGRSCSRPQSYAHSCLTHHRAHSKLDRESDGFTQSEGDASFSSEGDASFSKAALT
jgi:hypothetical protein